MITMIKKCCVCQTDITHYCLISSNFRSEQSFKAIGTCTSHKEDLAKAFPTGIMLLKNEVECMSVLME